MRTLIPSCLCVLFKFPTVAKAKASLSVVTQCADLACSVGGIKAYVQPLVLYTRNNLTTAQPRLACPVCRRAFDHNTSFVRSYVVDEVMDRHTQLLTAHEYPGWEPLGTEILQWTERKT